MTEQVRHITVLRPGPLTLIEDGGRPGLGHLAIPPSGALDKKAWRLANRLVGNDESEAVLETTVGGVEFRVDCDCVIAVTGAMAPVEVDGVPAEWGMPLPLRPGQIVNVGVATVAVRCYVALSGGIDVDCVFGSRSTDILSGLGPSPLKDGDRISLGPVLGEVPAVDFVPYRVPQDEISIPVFLGPRHDWLTSESLFALSEQVWTVGTASNRVAIRLEGAQLERSRKGELFSEGMVTGSLQIHSDGTPVIFLADHPTTGGYPVVGVITGEGLDLCAQARPGTLVSFKVRYPDWRIEHIHRNI